MLQPAVFKFVTQGFGGNMIKSNHVSSKALIRIFFSVVFSTLFFKKICLFCMCTGLHACPWTLGCKCLWRLEISHLPGAGVISSSELPDLDAGNWTWVLPSSSKHSQLLSHFSTPQFPLLKKEKKKDCIVLWQSEFFFKLSALLCVHYQDST